MKQCCKESIFNSYFSLQYGKGDKAVAAFQCYECFALITISLKIIEEETYSIETREQVKRYMKEI